jgi:hypothetical protein
MVAPQQSAQHHETPKDFHEEHEPAEQPAVYIDKRVWCHTALLHIMQSKRVFTGGNRDRHG